MDRYRCPKNVNYNMLGQGHWDMEVPIIALLMSYALKIKLKVRIPPNNDVSTIKIEEI